jgi:hypothetical protein
MLQRALHAKTIHGYLMKTTFLLLLRPIQIRNIRPQQGRSRPIPENMEAAGVSAFRLNDDEPIADTLPVRICPYA